MKEMSSIGGNSPFHCSCPHCGTSTVSRDQLDIGPPTDKGFITTLTQKSHSLLKSLEEIESGDEKGY